MCRAQNLAFIFRCAGVGVCSSNVWIWCPGVCISNSLPSSIFDIFTTCLQCVSEWAKPNAKTTTESLHGIELRDESSLHEPIERLKDLRPLVAKINCCLPSMQDSPECVNSFHKIHSIRGIHHVNE